MLQKKMILVDVYLQLFTMLHNPASVTSQHQLNAR